MKKVIILSIIFSCCSLYSYCQTNISDSLRVALKSTQKPIERFGILNDLVLELNSTGTVVDSAGTMEMLQIARQLNNDSLLAISYNWLGSYFYYNNGDNTTALQYYFKGIPFAEKARDNRRISSLYFDIAVVYFDIQENELAFRANQRGKENLPDTSSPMYWFMLVQYQSNMTQYYLLKKQADSAYLYAKETAKSYEKFDDNISYRFISYTFQAAAYTLKQMPGMAEMYFSKVLAIFNSTNRPSDWTLFYTNYIPFLLQHNRNKEAKAQAHQALAYGMQGNNNVLKLAAAGYLRQIFDAAGRLDSAYYFSRMEAGINNLIFSSSNKSKVQALTIAERMRSFEDERKKEAYQNKLVLYGLLTGLGVFLLVGFLLLRNNRQKQKANKILQQTLGNLKATQSQLIQSEKMASLGELTAGIAHEIQNPLNFVNNFSEVSAELADELKDAVAKNDNEEAIAIADDIKENLNKINHHGKRADAIVKGMLQHSQSSSGKKEPTDINALADEYLRLGYHGMRAKDKSFNATLKTDFDESIGNINIIPQDVGRVIMNLINNAFYACAERSRSAATERSRSEGDNSYEPTVSVSTNRIGDKIEISVSDNGNGISETIKEKIFQPFFTTKPTGEGTGLGLSLAYDIVKAHGGVLKVNSRDGIGSEFIISLPVI